MANVTLVNRTKRPRKMLVLNLTRQVAPVKIVNRTTDEGRDGLRRKRISSKFVAGSIRIPSGKSLEVDEKFLGCPEVKAAIKRRDLLVKREGATPVKGEKAAAKPVATTAETRVSDEGPKTRRRR